MPDKETIEKAREDEREGKSPSTQAGELVREEMQHIREGKHGAASTKQAIAIGLSKARRAGVKLNAPQEGKASPEVRRKAQQDLRKGESTGDHEPSRIRSRTTSQALKREPNSAASKKNFSRQGRSAAASRTSASRHQSAMKAVRTKGKSGLRQAAKKAAKTRSSHRQTA